MRMMTAGPGGAYTLRVTNRTLVTWVALGTSVVGVAAIVVAGRSGQASRSAPTDHAQPSLAAHAPRAPTAAIGMPLTAAVRRHARAALTSPSTSSNVALGIGSQGRGMGSPQPGANESDAQTQLERRWAQQESNLQWTEEASAYMESAMDAANIPADRLEALECHGDLCRIQMRFTSDKEAGGLYELRNPDYEVTFFRDGEYVTVFVSPLKPQASPQDQPVAQAAQPAPEKTGQ